MDQTIDLANLKSGGYMSLELIDRSKNEPQDITVEIRVLDKKRPSERREEWGE